MANPPPPTATYPAMGTRVGFSDGNPLTTALLNALAGDLAAQDGNGNVRQIVSVRVGPNAFLMADPSGNTWYTFNAYYDTGSSAWYPVNSAVVSYGIGNRNPRPIRSCRRRCRQSDLYLDEFG